MDKIVGSTTKYGVTYGRGYAYAIRFHLVWTTNSLLPVLEGDAAKLAEELLRGMADEYRFRIVKLNVRPDRIHLLLDCRPQFFVSDMIKIFKGNIARRLFAVYPELKNKLPGGHLWNTSYLVVSENDLSREQIAEYITSQERKSKRGEHNDI